MNEQTNTTQTHMWGKNKWTNDHQIAPKEINWIANTDDTDDVCDSGFSIDRKILPK